MCWPYQRNAISILDDYRAKQSLVEFRAARLCECTWLCCRRSAKWHLAIDQRRTFDVQVLSQRSDPSYSSRCGTVVHAFHGAKTKPDQRSLI